MRILKICSGLMLIFTGIWCFANQGVTFQALAFVLGIVMIITGIIGALTFATIKHRPEGLGWMFSESLITIILGIVVLSGQLATELTISVFFGMWLLFSSSNRIVGAITMRRQKSLAWSWTLGFGALGLCVGIYAFINSTFAWMSAGMLVALVFLTYGINVLTMGIALPHVKSKRKRKKKNLVAQAGSGINENEVKEEKEI